MIYYLDVHGRGSWADCFLQGMCYNCAPGRLQAAIKRVFDQSGEGMPGEEY